MIDKETEKNRLAVLLLGAGASAASEYELPTMEGFFRRRDFKPKKYPELVRFLCAFCGLKRKGKALEKINLEEVLTYLDNLERGALPVTQERRLELSLVRKQLDDYVLLRLVTRPLENKPPEGSEDPDGAKWSDFFCDRHCRVFSNLDFEKDSIMTLNYDLIADGTLEGMKNGKQAKGTPVEDSARKEERADVRDFVERSKGLLGMYGWDESPVGPSVETIADSYFLKLHGSLDYYCCPNATCSNHAALHPNQTSWRGGLLAKGAFCNACGRGLVLGIVPPTLSKTGEDFPRIGAIWSMAYNKLKEADWWVIWGVSLADSDHMLRALLREAAVEFYTRNPKGSLRIDVIDPAFKKKDVLAALARTPQGEVREYHDVKAWLEGKEKDA